MVEAVLDLFEVHGEMVFGHSPVIVQDMLGKTPEPLNAVDMILAAIGQSLGMIQTMVLAPALERVVAAEGVRVVDRPLAGMGPYVRHQLIGRHPFHHLGIHPAIALQKAENNALSGSASSALAFPPAAEVRLINLDFALQLFGLQLGHMVDRLTQTLVDAAHRLVVQAQIRADAIGRLLLVESGDDGDFLPQPLQRLLPAAGCVPAAHVPAFGSVDLEGTAEDALSASQKVGRTVENVLPSSNHEGILALDGYESN